MEIRLHDDPAAFARAARPLLEADPVRHTLALTTIAGVCHGSLTPALLVTLHRRGALAGVALRTAGRPTIVSALPPACAVTADAAMAAADPAPPGAIGPVAEAEAYAAAVTARTGAAARVAMRQRLFRLCALQAPVGVGGVARPAGPEDADRLAAWLDAFQVEVRLDGGPPEDQRDAVRSALAHGSAFLLWEVDGMPVAFAGARWPTAGMSRVGPVYTAPAHRGRGYGSAVTAAATAWSLAAGARDVVLFTDLANPVSNAIYPRIGYRPVHDTVDLRFG